MGLELEPVITSSERTIGCRVKDFYFGLEYDGLDRQYLQEHVATGDIIIKVNDTAVVSLPFSKILDILRSLAGSSRVVVFKNITAAWESSLISTRKNVPAGSPTPKASVPSISIGAPHTQLKTAGTARLFFADAENISQNVPQKQGRQMQVQDKGGKGDEGLSAQPAALTQMHAQRASAATGEVQQRRLGAPSPKKLSAQASSPLPPKNKSLQKMLGQAQAQGLTQGQAQTQGAQAPSPLPPPLVVPKTSLTLDVRRSPSQTPLRRSQSAPGCLSPLTPSSIVRLIQQREGRAGASSGAMRQSTDSDGLLATDLADPAGWPAQTDADAHTDTLGFDKDRLRLILDKVGGSIGSGLAIVGSALGVRAERALQQTSDLLPLYSNAEVKEMMGRKYDLLSELSESCMLLGQAEAREELYNQQQLQHDQLTSQVAALQGQVEAAQLLRDGLQFKLKATETELSVLKLEHSQDQQATAGAKEAAVGVQERLDALQRQFEALSAAHRKAEAGLITAEADLSRLRRELQRKEKDFQKQNSKLTEENHSLKQRIEAVGTEAKVRVTKAEKDRDSAAAELEVMLEMTASDGKAAMAECARLREGMAAQQFLHKERLVQCDKELHSLRGELRDTKDGVTTVGALYEGSRGEGVALQAELEAVQRELRATQAAHAAAVEALASSRALTGAETRKAEEADAQLREQRVRMNVSDAEHGMLSDRAQLEKLNSAALLTEMGMLRRELEAQKDELRLKDITVMTAVTKANALEATAADLRAEVSSKDVQLAALEQSIAYLAEERDVQLGVSQESAAQCCALQELVRTLGDAKQATADRHSAQVDELTQQRHSLSSELAAALAQAQSLSESAGELHSERAHLQQQHSEEVERKAGEISALTASKASLKAQLGELEDSLSANLQLRDSELSSVRCKASCVEDTLAQVRADTNRLSTQHRAQLAAKDEGLATLGEKFELLKGELAQAAAEHEGREKEFLSALSLAEDTQDSLRSDLHQQLSERAEQCAQQAQRAGRLDKDLADMRVQLEAAVQQRAEEGRVFGDETLALQSEVQEQQARLSLLEARSAVSLESRQKSASQAAAVQTELATVTRALLASSAEKEQMQGQVQEASQQLAAVQAKATTDRRSVFAALREASLELAQLKSSLTETRSDVVGLGGIHGSIAKALQAQARDAQCQLAAVTDRQPAQQHLEGRVSQLLREKEAASRRAATAEQNTIESEARCVDALTKAMNADKAAAEGRSRAIQRGEELAAAEAEAVQLRREVEKLAGERGAVTARLSREEAAGRERAAESEQLQTALGEQQALLADAETRAQISSEEMAGLWAQVESLQGERVQWESTLSCSQAQRLEQGASVSKFQSASAALQRQLEGVQKQRADDERRFKGHVAALEKQIETLTSSSGDTFAEFERHSLALQEQLRGVQASAEDAQQWSGRYEQAVADAESAADVQRCEREQLITSYDRQLEGQQRQRDSIAEELQSLRASHQADLESSQAALSASQEERHREALGLGVEQARIMQEQVEAFRSALAEAGVSRGELQQRLVAELDAVQAAQRQVDSLRGDLESQQTELMELTASLRRSMSERETQGRAYQERIGVLQCAQNEAETAARAAEVLVASVREKLDDREQAYSALEHEHAQGEQTRAEERAEVVSAREAVAAMEAELTTARSNIASNEDSVKLVLRDLEISLERKRELKQQLGDAQLAQRSVERQTESTRAMAGEMHATIQAQERALEIAEGREAEYASNRRKLEGLIADTNAQCQRLRAELTKQGQKGQGQLGDAETALQTEIATATARTRRAEADLEEKCSELRGLHQFVTELLASTPSPRKPPAPAQSPPVSLRPPLCEIDPLGALYAEDKENVLGGDCQEQPNSDFEVEQGGQEDWQNGLLVHSIAMYEQLGEAFRHMQHLRILHAQAQELGLEGVALRVDALSGLCFDLSCEQQALHMLLVRAPWSGSEPVAVLPPAHGPYTLPIAEMETYSPSSTASPVRSAEGLERPSRAPASPSGADVAEEGDRVRISSDSANSASLEELLACIRDTEGAGDADADVEVVFRTSRGGSSGGSGGRSAARTRRGEGDALALAARVSAEIGLDLGEVHFDAFRDESLVATPPTIKRLLHGRGDSRDSERGEGRDRDESFESAASDLFNLSAETDGSSDDESTLFRRIQ
ncbi:hypothetical protein B484DRAFT_396228 [Ochromonadaceae sp. CCMP2298]|nr:hypothetical protein B484DRAFT_396228 [Ochromonadaceae sp. CCMP2298]